MSDISRDLFCEVRCLTPPVDVWIRMYHVYVIGVRSDSGSDVDVMLHTISFLCWEMEIISGFPIYNIDILY